MKPLTLLLTAILLSAPALAQQQSTNTATPSVVKKRTPSLTLEGKGQVFKSQAELDEEARDARWAAIRADLQDKEDARDADEQRRQDDNAEARRVIDSRLPHHKAPRRPSPFRLRH